MCGSVRLGILDFLKDVGRWLAYQDLFWLLSELSSPGLTNLAEVRKGEPLKKQGGRDRSAPIYIYIYVYTHIVYTTIPASGDRTDGSRCVFMFVLTLFRILLSCAYMFKVWVKISFMDLLTCWYCFACISVEDGMVVKGWLLVYHGFTVLLL